MRYELEEGYQQWKLGKISTKALKQMLLKNAYQQAKKHFYQFSDDEIQDLMLQFYLNLNKLLVRYDSNRKSLSSFIFMFLSYQLSNIRSRSINKTVRCQIAACGNFHYSELPKGRDGISHERTFDGKNRYEDEPPLDMVSEIPCRYGSSNLSIEENLIQEEELKELKSDLKEKIAVNDPAVKRKALISFLKRINRLTPTEQEQFCQIFELNEEETFHYCYLLSQLTKEKRDRKTHYEEIMNHHFNTLQLLRYQLFNAEDPYLKMMLKEKIKRLETKLKMVTIKYEKVKVDPSNRELAQVLGIPKGTIDSFFFQNNTKKLIAPFL